MNIIILAAGEGKRFSEEHYLEPKPIIKVLTTPIIDWLVNSLDINFDDKILFVLNKNHSTFRIKESLTHKFKSKSLLFHEVEFNTRGAAETLYSAIDKIDNDDPILVLDSDTFYNENIVIKSKAIKDNFIFYFKTNTEDSIYSYIEIDNNSIINIQEKIKISNNACSGAYGFKNKTIIKKYCELILDKKIKTKNEYYISCLYQEMLKNKENIVPIEINYNNIICLGTPNQIKSFSSSNFDKIKNKTFCFDLDNTLVTYPEICGDYSTVKPIKENILLLQKLKFNNKIIIHTARRMKTHHGNVNKVIDDIFEVTKNTLIKFKIPYDELIFGKPYADFYIDDNAINATLDISKQLGIYENYIEPRKNNLVQIQNNLVIKTTSNKGEAYWYSNIPDSINHFFPKVFQVTENIIKMEKINASPCSYTYINGTLTKNCFYDILNSLNEIHNSVNTDINKSIFTNIYDNYEEKLKLRYESYDYSKFYNSKNVYKELSDQFKKYKNENKGIIKVIHGDPVFSNILIDDNIKFIDMRGKVGDEYTIFGDENYDWAKIYQSIVGYDFILLNKNIKNDLVTKYKEYFYNWLVRNNKEKQFDSIKLITKSLLFTLIPLHDNEKCDLYYKLIDSI
jgi:capsule biosynthesis phosphatase